ncbi:MAG: hypothetical protein KDD61_11820 [Bdellovibrionales bacterium]|nr:hypothetical protein [Bdellovibrionales bacterium]
MVYFVIFILVISMQNCTLLEAPLPAEMIQVSRHTELSKQELVDLLNSSDQVLFEISTKTEPEARYLAQKLALAHNDLHRHVFPDPLAEPIASTIEESLNQVQEVLPIIHKYLRGENQAEVTQMMLSETASESSQSPFTHRLSELAVSNDTLLIGPGAVVLIDTDIHVGLLSIQGELHCPETGRFKFSVQAVKISGKFICGQATRRFLGQLEIGIRPGLSLGHMGERSFSVMSGGEWRFYGSNQNSTWLYLTQTARAGDSTIVLSSPVSWQPGDEVVIGPTTFRHTEAERRQVVSVSQNRVQLDRPLTYTHWGSVQNFARGASRWQLNHRAEVANLTRNIKIYSEGGDFLASYLGAHSMVMNGGKAFVDSVEFSNMGRMGEMARYPFHWHRAGEVSGQFIVNSSIHDSYQRCITVHGTLGALVQNNVCFNHFGHGFFLEDGNEERNRLIGNLGMLSKRPPRGREVLQSDVTGLFDRFSPPSTFWISHPNNYIVGNVASGSEGSGFWMSFRRAIKCDNTGCFVVSPQSSGVTHRPLFSVTWSFQRNIAHSNDVGFTWDGADDGALAGNPNNSTDRQLVTAHYFPSVVPHFDYLTAYKSRRAGAYFRGSTAKFRNSIFADNRWSLFFAYNQVVEDTLVIGKSENYSSADDAVLRQGPKGIIIYDGPFELNRVHFADFSSQRETYQGLDVTSIPFFPIGGANRWVNQVVDVSFSPQPTQMIDLNPAAGLNWDDSLWSMAVKDVNGILTGTPGALIVPDHPLHEDARCTKNATWKALICRYDVGLLTFRTPGDSNLTPFRVTRSDGKRSIASLDQLQQVTLHNKANMILDRYEYTFEFPENYSRPNNLGVIFQAEQLSRLSPVIRLLGYGHNCSLSGATAMASLNLLRNSQQMSYFASGDDFYVKLKAAHSMPDHSSQYANKGTSRALSIQCQSDIIDRGPAGEPNPPVEPNPTIGPIDGVIGGVINQDDTAIVHGWACFKKHPGSIGVHLYVGGPAGSGQLLKTSVANRNSEAAVSTLCQTSEIPHRFQFELSANERNAHAEKPIYIHGIVPEGIQQPNSLLVNSGDFTVPPLGPVKGYIDGVALEGGKYYIKGWACYRGYEKAIAVHVYLGGSAATGTLLKGVAASVAGEPEVAAACMTDSAQHRFRIEMTNAERDLHRGKKIYIHGINPINSSGGTNLLIGQSGIHAVP